MTTIAKFILDLLNDDMVSHGLLVQCVEDGEIAGDDPKPIWKHVLEELISGDVEIGTARQASPEYVEFIAWRGNTNDCILRALESVRTANEFDREFAYWLCLRGNVDRYEGEAP